MEIIATLPVSPAQREIFAEIAPHAHFTYTDKAHITQEQVKKAEVILGNLPASLLKSADKLRKADQCFGRIRLGHFRAYSGHGAVPNEKAA